MNNEYIRNLNHREMLLGLSKMSQRKFIRRYYSYYNEMRGVLEEKGINPKILKNRVTPAQLRRFMQIGLSKNKVSMLLGISVSTLKKVGYQQGADISPIDEEEEKRRNQKIIDCLRTRGYTQLDLAYIFCSYVDKLKKEYDLKSELPVINARTEAKKLLYRKSFMTGNLYSEIFTDEEDEL